MGVHDRLELGQFGPRGLIGKIYVGITKHCWIQNILALGLMVSEKKIFLRFFHYKSLGANDPRGVASLGSRDLIGSIYVADH